MVIGHGHEVGFHVSTQAGVVRQTERHLHDDPPPEAQQRELTADVEAIIAGAVPDAEASAVRRGDRRGRDGHLPGRDRPVAGPL